jgi:hypothetical protein
LKSIVLLSLFSLTLAFGQEPSYYILGGDELAGIHIYDLNQDDQSNYWLATNEGLYRYDGYEFFKMKSDEMFSESLFNLRIDSEDNVYCHNLSGQIFKVKGDSCKFYFQIPDSLMKEEISLSLDQDDDLLVLARKLFVVHKDFSIRVLNRTENISIGGGIFDFENEEKIVFDYRSSELYRVKNKELKSLTKTPLGIWPTFFKLNNEFVGFDLTTTDLLFSDGEINHDLTASTRDRSRIYCDGRNVWFASLKGGVKVQKGLNQPLFSDKAVFSNFFISAMMRDKENNIVIGTFRDGLIVIPNISSTTYQLPDRYDKPTQLVTSDQFGVFVGSQNGKVYRLFPSGKMKVFYQNNSKFIEFMAYFPQTREIMVDDKVPNFIDVHTGQTQNTVAGAVKDMKQVSGETYLMATNMGVRWIDIRTKEQWVMDEYKLRTNAVGYNPKTKRIYAGTSLGLYIGTEDKSENYTLRGQNILAKYIISKADTIMICTQDNGILNFVHDTIHTEWNVTNGLPSNHISKIVPYKNDYVLSTDKGVCIISATGKTKRWIRIPEGLTTDRVTDIAIHNDFLYVSHSSAIQRIDLADLPDDNQIPELILNAVEVNDVKQKFTSQEKPTYRFDHNRFTFEFALKTLKYRTEILYQYKLEGIDESWQTNSYGDNRIEYKSLPSGEYSFRYRTSYRGNLSGEKTFVFAIATPFWRLWWFWTLCAALFVLATYFVYTAQTKRQKVLAQNQRALVASKLTAIQSQMNPHFIFNSLNSIQDLVLRQDGENAYNYISKFAFLVRKVLAFSEEEFIDIEDEFQMLNVYLELEELRFRKDFEFEIIHEDPEDVMIPPMIIQPFVENALKHGLLHKKGEKRLKILTFLEEHSLRCIIEDNGVGREKSAQINKRKSQKHDSFSVKSIRSRFDILKSKYGGELGVEFEDLYEKNQATGTRVILKIPVRRKF